MPLIEDDLKRYPEIQVAEVQKRLEDVPIEDVRKCMYKMVKEGVLEHSKDKTYRKYWMAKKN